MSITQITESRAYDRILESARERFWPTVVNNAYDSSPLVSIMSGRLNAPMFGADGPTGRGKDTVDGGESIVVKTRLGKNSTVKDLSGAWAEYDLSPQKNVVHGRANWKLYGGAVNIADHEVNTASGEHQIINIIEDEMTDAANALADLIGDHLYDNGSVTTRVSALDDIVSGDFETDAIYGLDGSVYSDWNIRGVSARGTAAASVSVTGGSFAATGLSNWRIAWNNASEGTMERPQALMTTHAVYQFYEGSLQPQERFNDNRLADGGFMNLQFKSAPVLPDPKCTSGATYFLNFDHLRLVVLSGADFGATEFHSAEKQRARVSKIFWTGELVCDSRKLQNKVLSQTA